MNETRYWEIDGERYPSIIILAHGMKKWFEKLRRQELDVEKFSKNLDQGLDVAIRFMERSRLREEVEGVSYMFESYGNPNAFSLLNPVADRVLDKSGELVNVTVRRAMERGEYGGCGRILNPIIRYNLDQALEKEFAFKPKVFNDTRLAEFYEKRVKAFREFGPSRFVSEAESYLAFFESENKGTYLEKCPHLGEK
tara:strand:+ start:28 stop:615 length:588 start_codon:yes stop_codon:yes gene_type:complete